MKASAAPMSIIDMMKSIKMKNKGKQAILTLNMAKSSSLVPTVKLVYMGLVGAAIDTVIKGLAKEEKIDL